MIPPRIKEVKAVEDYKIEILYVNGEKKLYDMKKNLKHKFYEKLNNPEYFKLVKNAQTTVEWTNGEDVDPNDLYGNSVDITRA